MNIMIFNDLGSLNSDHLNSASNFCIFSILTKTPSVMKKNLLTLIAFLLFLPAIAQITITSDDIVGAGATVILGVDTTSPFTAGPGGADQNWDFSSVLTQAYDTMWFMNPGQTTFPDAYPAANLAARIYMEDAFMYFNSNSQEFSILGGMMRMDELPGLDLYAPITPKEVIAAFPMDYLDNYTQSFVQEIRAPNPIPALGFDSVMIKMYTTQTTIVDAWGTVTTPLGSFEALRVRDNSTMIDSIFAFMLGSWNLLETDGDVDEDYSWWTDEPGIGYPVLELNVDTETGFVEDVYFLKQEPVYGVSEPALERSAMVLYPNPCSDVVRLRYLIHDIGYLKSDLFDISGRKILELINQNLMPGDHEIEIDVSSLSNGMYFVRAQVGNSVEVQKLVVTNH